MSDDIYIFKVGDAVLFRGLKGIVYQVEEDLTAVKFPNICPDDEFKDKFLEFDKNGYRFKWQKDPDLILVKE